MAKNQSFRISSPDAEDPLVLFLNARGFELLVKVAHAYPVNKSLLMFPTVANESLTLELYLKCLHRIRRSKRFGHDTKQLFDALSEADKKVISGHLLDSVRSHPDYLLMYTKGVSFEPEAVAQRASNTFVTGRYWSELNLPNADCDGFVGNMGVMNLCDAVRILILELHPDWAEKADNFRFRMPGGNQLPS